MKESAKRERTVFLIVFQQWWSQRDLSHMVLRLSVEAVEANPHIDTEASMNEKVSDLHMRFQEMADDTFNEIPKASKAGFGPHPPRVAMG